MSTENNHTNDDVELRKIDEESREFACDRCRGQKLRCERRFTGRSSNPCNRCVKARCKCTTSPPRRKGRPKQQSIPAIRDSHELDFNKFFTSIDVKTSLDNGELSTSTISAPVNNRNPDGKEGEFPQIDSINHDYSASELLTDNPVFHGDQNYYNKNTNHSPPADFREECLQKLSDLNSGLFRQWSRLSSGQLAKWLTLSPSPSPSSTLQVTDLSNYMASDCAKSPIGNMLDISREFLDVLKFFGRSPLTNSSASPPGSPCSVFHENLPADFRQNSTHSYSYPQSRILSYESSSPNSDLTNTPDSFNSWRSDLPTTFAILTCYVCLARIYSTIFSHIYHLLLSCPSQVESTPIFPGLQLGGFQIDNHRNLQIKILMQVSIHMLSQIETALGLPYDRCIFGNCAAGNQNRKNILEDSISASFLEIVMKQEVVGNTEGARTGVMPLKQTLESIRRLLRGRTEL